jgi:HPt (histidine-containing phosphotransfer) domain-containing protein
MILHADEFGPAAMSLNLDRIDWMPSPPLVPDEGPIDLAHLRRMTLGDAELEREVLTMFSAQALRLVKALGDKQADASALAHKLKGSAQAIGAFGVADAASYLETLVRSGDDTVEAKSDLHSAVDEANSAIEAFLSQS